MTLAEYKKRLIGKLVKVAPNNNLYDKKHIDKIGTIIDFHGQVAKIQFCDGWYWVGDDNIELFDNNKPLPLPG